MAATWPLRLVLIVAVVAALVAKLVYRIEIDTTVIALVAVGSIALCGRFDLSELEVAGIRFGFGKKTAGKTPGANAVAEPAPPMSSSAPRRATIAPSQIGLDPYGVQLLKLMPLETVLIYLLSVRVLQSDADLIPSAPWVLWAVFGVCLSCSHL